MIDTLTPEQAARRDRLLAILAEMPSVVVAFSGGVDSSVVAAAAQQALGERAVAVTADSPSVPRSELAAAQHLAAAIGIRHRTLPTHEFDNADYLRNDGSRCYHCKSTLYDTILAHRSDLGGGIVVSGANVDDAGDYRPGLTAAAERAVRHPLQEAGCTKADVRAIAHAWGLPVWDKPASPCLSSRLAPGLPVTAERTARIEAAEAYLRELGLRDCRVRLHPGELARIEVPVAAVAGLAQDGVRTALAARLRSLGFAYITLDLEGFRSGSMNELVNVEVRRRFVAGGAL